MKRTKQIFLSLLLTASMCVGTNGNTTTLLAAAEEAEKETVEMVNEHTAKVHGCTLNFTVTSSTHSFSGGHIKPDVKLVITNNTTNQKTVLTDSDLKKMGSVTYANNRDANRNSKFEDLPGKENERPSARFSVECSKLGITDNCEHEKINFVNYFDIIQAQSIPVLPFISGVAYDSNNKIINCNGKIPFVCLYSPEYSYILQEGYDFIITETSVDETNHSVSFKITGNDTTNLSKNGYLSLSEEDSLHHPEEDEPLNFILTRNTDKSGCTLKVEGISFENCITEELVSFDEDFYGNTVTYNKDMKKNGSFVFPETICSVATPLKNVERAVYPYIPLQPSFSSYYLENGVDYDILYKNNDKIGTATLIIQGKGAYKNNSLEKTFEIKPYELKRNMFLVENQTTDETGKKVGPFCYPKREYDWIKEKDDYSLEIDEKNKIIHVNGVNNCSGTIDIPYKYEAHDLSSDTVKLDTSSETTYNYTGKPITPNISLYERYENGSVKHLTQQKDYTLEHGEIKEVGKYTITIVGAGSYTGTSRTIDIEVLPSSNVEINIKKTKVSNELRAYYGSDYIFSASITDKNNGYVLKEGKDYKMTQNITNTSATITVSTNDIKGNYNFHKSQTFRLPKNTGIKISAKATAKLTAPKVSAKYFKKGNTKYIKLSWKKIKGAKGYQILYRTNKKKGNYYLLKTVKKTSATLKCPKKKYYYYVRAYKMIKKKKAYGKVSSGKRK